jgi:hypothetical protein
VTFLELQQSVYRDCGYKDTPAADVITRVKGWISQGHRRVLRDPRFSKLRMGSVPFSSVNGVTTYGIPEVFERMDKIVQQTNDRPLTFMSQAKYRIIDPAERSTGTPDSYVPMGYGVIFRKLATDGGIWAVSTDAADTTQTLTYQGIDTNGDILSPGQVTLTGTSRVRLGAFTFHDLVSWNISAAAAGRVSLYDAASSGNEIGRIPIGQRSVRYLLIRLWPTPVSVLPYLVDGQFKIFDLINDTDVPMWPESFHDVCADYARMKEYERTGDARLQTAAGMYSDGKEKLRQMVEWPDDYYPVAGSVASAVKRNNLGGWFPADNGLL